MIQLQTRETKALEAEVLALRQQVRVLERQVKRVRWQPSDRLILSVLLERLPRSAWAGLLVQPETVLGWHRELVRRRWAAYRGRRRVGRSPLPEECRELVRQMAEENPTWGYFRIRGELMKPGYTVSATAIRISRRARLGGLLSDYSPRVFSFVINFVYPTGYRVDWPNTDVDARMMAVVVLANCQCHELPQPDSTVPMACHLDETRGDSHLPVKPRADSAWAHEYSPFDHTTRSRPVAAQCAVACPYSRYSPSWPHRFGDLPFSRISAIWPARAGDHSSPHDWPYERCASA